MVDIPLAAAVEMREKIQISLEAYSSSKQTSPCHLDQEKKDAVQKGCKIEAAELGGQDKAHLGVPLTCVWQVESKAANYGFQCP